MKDEADHVFLLYGDNSDKQNEGIRARLKQIPKNESLILVTTGQKIGEGFNFPRLDVLMLAAPVSFEGRLEQYVGRLSRDYAGKEAVYVYDYIDTHVRFFNKMYAKRLRTYKKTEFAIWMGELQSIRFAVIDDEFVWHGGMNLLGKVDVWDKKSIRAESWCRNQL